MSTIIIIDDSATNRAIYSQFASTLHHGVQVVSFGDPTLALEWLEHSTADLVITDYKMPGMNGADFVRRLRERAGDSDIPVIVVTAYADRAFRMQALDAGATDFLLSPVDHYEFAARGRNLLQLRRQQQGIKQRAALLAEKLKDSEQAHQELMRDSRDALAQVIDTLPALISAADRDGRCLFVNESLARFAGLSTGNLAQVDGATLLGSDHAESSRTLNARVFETGEVLAGREEVVTDLAGSRRTLLTTRTPLRNAANEVVSVLTTSVDITAQKLAEQSLAYLAHHDTLTDLPNRTLLRSRLRQALARGRRGDRLFALHFIDLDRFKAINDGLGHHVGDQLLTAVGRRLIETVRDGDTVARLGGDEFAIIQADIGSPQDAADLAERITRMLTVPFVFEDQELTIGASIGITISPRAVGDADSLLRNADLAMYRAKAAGRSTWRFFATEMGPHAREAVRLEVDLRNSLSRGEFLLHYQPQIDLATGSVVGCEALLRWRRPGTGLVRPADFLGLAEETELILPISTWVLREACLQARRWQDAGLRTLRMGVNLSPVQFRRLDVYDLVVRTLAETGLSPDVLDLELTESILMESAEEAAAVLKRLRNLGIGLSVDDFGTGYSSLSYVKKFPLNRLKIDQSFIRGLVTDPSDKAIIRAILDLGHTLRLTVVAEGIEDAEQARLLLQDGCDEGQGYYFSEPIAADAFAALLERGGTLPRPDGGA